jgi:hypothetical protein
MDRIARFFLMLVLVLFSACDGQNVGVSHSMPDSTPAVVSHQDFCHNSYWDNMDYVMDQMNKCITDGNDPDLCSENMTEDGNESLDNLFLCLKGLPMVSDDCRAGLNPENIESDYDGDGVSDFYESHMALNPCEKCSYGGTEGIDCDGDLDFDGDGTPNAEDLNPACGGNYYECWF